MIDQQRHGRRVKLSLAVSYRTTGAFLVAYSVNLSKGGIFLEANPLPVGTHLELAVEVPGIGPVGVSGEVTWTRDEAQEGLPVGMGIRFHEEIEDAIGRHIDLLAASFEGIELLVVSAAPERRAQLVRYARSILSCECVEVASRPAAEVALADRVDLALVDLDTSGQDGMDIIEEARRDATPVIALSSAPELKQWAREAGVDAVLGAPPSFPDLQQAVIAALARPVLKKQT